MTQQAPYGKTEMLVFRSLRERLVYAVLIRALFALRFAACDCERAAEWLIILWRVLRFAGSDKELQDQGCGLHRYLELPPAL